MSRIHLLIFIFLFAITSDVFAQEKLIKFDYSQDAKINGKWLKDFGKDFIATGLSPLSWKAKNWATFGGVAFVGGGLMLTDEHIYDFMHDHSSPFIQHQSKNLLNDLWSFTYILPAMGLTYAGARIFKEDRLSFTLLTTVRAFAVTTVFTGGMKMFFHRYRPYEHTPPNAYLWNGPSLDTDHLSFPSGHSSLAFAVAAVVASEYHDYTLVPYIAYGLAGLTAVSRIYAEKHWPSDVFFGSVLGYSIGRFIYKRAKGNLPKKENGDFSISPVFLPGGSGGLSLVLHL